MGVAPTNLPWGLEIYRRIDPATGLSDPIAGVAVDHTPIAVVHPTFLYELIWNVLVALVVLWADRKFRMGRGRVFALYVAGYTLGRLFVELLRADEATHIFGVRINVFTSIVVFLLAVLYLFLVRGGREDPESLRGKPLPGDDDEEPVAAPVSGGAAESSDAEAEDGAEAQARTTGSREDESPGD